MENYVVETKGLPNGRPIPSGNSSPVTLTPPSSGSLRARIVTGIRSTATGARSALSGAARALRRNLVPL